MGKLRIALGILVLCAAGSWGRFLQPLKLCLP